MGPVRPDDLDQSLNVAAAWGEEGGYLWPVWTDQDISCLALTALGGEWGPFDEENCPNGFTGGDLRYSGTCVYGCDANILYGVVSTSVARVDLVLKGGDTYVGKIHPTPEGVTEDARVFTLPVPRSWVDAPEDQTGTLRALAEDGTVLAELSYPS